MADLSENGAAKQLDALIRARYSLVFLVSAEESRVEAAIQAVASKREMTTYFWGCSRGFIDALGEADGTSDPIGALQKIRESTERALYVLRDFHCFLEDSVVRRWVRDLAVELRNCTPGKEKTIIILAP